MSETGDTVGIGIRLEDDGSVGQYAQNLEQLIVRAINAASDVITSSLKQALLDVAGTFGSSFANAANVAKGSISGIQAQASTLAERLGAAEASAAAFADQLNIDPDAFGALEQSAKSLQELFDTLADSQKDFSAIDLRRLRAELDALRRASVEQLAQFQTTQSTVRTLLKSEADERNQLSRERAAADKSANSLRIVQEQTSSAQIVAQLRGASQERVALIQQETRRRSDLFKAATATIVALERSLGTVFEQTGKVLSGAFRGLTAVAQTAAKSIRSVFQRSNQQITDNYGKSLKQQEQLLQNSVKEQSGVIRKFAEQANQALGGIGGGRLAAAGAIGAIGGFLASSLRAGFNRFATLQEASRGLDILLGDATESAKLLDGVLNVVRGTPFGLELFADAAAQLVTFNFQAKEIPSLLAAIGDAAALKGSRAPEFIGRLVNIFGQISTQARVTGDDLTRLQEAGVPALQILGNQLGKTTLEIRDLVSSGQVGREAIEQLATGISQGTTGINGATVAFAGLAKSLGTTLRGSIANLGAARARLGAAIIGPFNDAFVGVVALFTKITDEVTKLISSLLKVFTGSAVFAQITKLIQRLNDDVAGVFERIRPIAAALARTILVVGAAFAALSSARVAATAVSLLAASISRVVSPLRILFAAATGITFVFTRLVRENLKLDTALGFLSESVQQILRPFKDVFETLRDGTSSLRIALNELFEGGLAVLATFVNNVIAPALFGLGIVIRRTVVPAVEAFTDRITQFVESGAGQQLSVIFSSVLSTASRFAEFVGTRVIPVLARIAAVVGGVVFVAVEQFVGLIQNRVIPLLAGAVTTLKEFATIIGTRVPEAFRNFGRAISDAFSSGSFSGVASAFKDFLLGLGPIAAVAGAAVALAFVNPFLGLGVLIAAGLAVAFGPTLLARIQPRLNDLRERVASALNFDNLLNISFNVLSLVNRLGRLLGRVVSDPRLIAAVAGIAAAGVALAGSFILGVIQGIGDNIPKLVRGIQNLVGDALVEGFKAALTNPLIGAALAAGFAALLFGPSVISDLRQSSANAATVIAQNFNNNIRRLTLQTQPLAQNASTFIQGLIGGPQALQAAAKAQAKQAQQIVSRESQRLRDTATAFGANIGGRSGLTDQQVGAFVNNLTEQFGPLGVAAGVARQSIERIGRQIRLVSRSGVAEFRNLKNAASLLNFRALSTSAQTFGVTLRVALQTATRELRNLGNSLRTAAPILFEKAGAVAGAAFASAFASAALFDSASSVSDKAGSILSLVGTFGATAAIAGAPVAALGLGVGVLAGAFQSVGKRAEEAKRRIEEIITVSSQFEDQQSAEALEARIVASFEGVPDKIRDSLADRGITLESFVNLDENQLKTTLALLQNIVDFGQTDLGADQEIASLSTLLGVDEKAIRSILGDLPKIRDAVKAVVEANAELARTDPFGSFGVQGDFINTLSTGVKEFAQNLLDTGLPLDEVKRRIAELERGVPAVVADFKAFGAELVRTGNAPLEFVTQLRELSKVRLGNLRNELNEFKTSLDIIDETIDTARDNIKRLLSGDEIDSSQLVDQSILAIRRIGESIEGSLGKPGEAARAELRGYLREARDQAAGLLSDAIENSIVTGVQFTAADAADLFAPLLRAANELGPETGQALAEQIGFVLEGFDFPPVQALIDERKGLEEAQKFGEKASEQVELLVDLEIKFDSALVKTGAARVARDAYEEILDQKELFSAAGIEIVNGVVTGVAEGSGALNDSIKALLLDAIAVATGPEGIDAQSPSRLTEDVIGFPIAAGIAAGIANGSPLVEQALDGIRQRIIAASADIIGGEFTTGFSAAASGASSFAEAARITSQQVDRLARSTRELDTKNTLDALQLATKVAGGAKEAIEELDLAINDLQRSLLQEFDIFNLDNANPFNEVVFNEGRKALNDLLTSIGGVADQFAKGLRDGTIAGVAASANAFGEFEQKVVEGLRQGIIDGSIQGVDDVNRTLDQIGIVVAEQLGPKNQAAIDEFDKLINGLRERSDIEALIIVELEEKALREAEEKLAEISDRINKLGNLTSRVFRGLLTQISAQVTEANAALFGLFDSLFGLNQLPGGPLGLADIGVIEDYAKKAGDALTGIFDRLLGRNQLATAAVTGDLDELLATRGEALDRITVGESLIEQLRAESADIENELRGVGGGLAEAFRTFFERGSAGEGAFRAQARAIGLSATEVENLVAKQRQLRVAQRDIAEALLIEAETSGKIAEEREKLRTANIELLESSIALLDSGEDGARIFQSIANAAGLNAAEIAELTEAYRKLRFEEQAKEISDLAEQDEKLREANQDLLESSLALIDAGPNGIKTFRDIGLAAGLSELEIQNLINKYNDLRVVEQQQTALELTLQQLELESSIRDSALALQELIDLGPEGSDFFNRLAELSGLNVDTARDLISEYGDIVARNSGAPPSDLFEGLRQFADSNVKIAQVLLDQYGNIVGQAGQNAPTRFFASLDGQVDRTASKISGVAGSIANLNAQLDELDRRQASQRPGFEGLDTIQIPGVTSSGFGPTGQPLFTIQNATFARPSDADLVAQRVNAAIGTRR